MREIDLLQLIGQAQDEYILDADLLPEKTKPKPQKPTARPLMRNLAAILAIVLALALFFQTPVGVAAAELVAEKITQFLDILFPPKQLLVQVEGMPETIPHEAQGREPEADTPGFAIYVDPSRYTMTQEGESWFIRPNPIPYDREEIRDQQHALLEGLSPEEQEAAIDKRIEELNAFYASLPPVEIEIREYPDKTPQTLTGEIYSQMKGQWETLTDPYSYWRDDQKEGITFSVSQGYASDAAQETHVFLDNSRGGCFHIVSRTYLEASEGHGTRFWAMIETFTTVAPQDPSQYSTPSDALVKAMEQEVAYAKEQNETLLEWVETHYTQMDMNTNAMDRSALWHDVHNKLWAALEQTLDEREMASLTREHYEWASRKREVLAATEAELDGGSMTALAVYGTDANWTQERVDVLLTYLQGTAVPPACPESVILSPDALVEEFVDAYFQGDLDTIRRHLSATFAGEVEGPPYDLDEIRIHATKGLYEIPHTMTQWGHLSPSVEFLEGPNYDSYTYLSLSLIWEQNQWKVDSYGLEK